MSCSKYGLTFIALLLFLVISTRVKTTSSLGEEVVTNACLLTEGPIYCTCDSSIPNDAHHVSCTFVAKTEPGDPAWLGFENQKGIRELVLTCMMDSRLNYLNSGVLSQLSNLTVLSLKEFSIDTLWPYTLANMTAIRNITMDNCDIQQLESFSVAFLPNLRMLSLSNNLISRIPTNALYRLPKLKNLHLERNEIVSIDDLVFVGMPLLEELSLWDNLIDRVTPKTFIGLTSLKRLYMYSNRLYRLVDGVFSGTPQLQELDLRNNKIETVSPHAFDGLNNLTSLLITDNKIRTLPKHVFKGAPYLQVIDLTRNQLVTFQQALLRPLRHSHGEHFVVFVRDNPLVCACDLLWITDYVKDVKSFLFEKELKHLKCHLDNSTQKIVKTTPIDLSCSDILSKNTPRPDKSKKWKHKSHQSTSTSEVTTYIPPPEITENIVVHHSHPPVHHSPQKPREEDTLGKQNQEDKETKSTQAPNMAEAKPEDQGPNSATGLSFFVSLQCFLALHGLQRLF